MDCLNNLVGRRGDCGGDTVPDSVYYIDDLAGIGFKEADAAINSEHANANAFLDGKITLAGDIVSNDIRTKFNPRFKGGSVLSTHTVGIFTQNQQSAAAQATYLVGKNFYISDGNYLELQLSKIGLQVDNTGTVDVFVYDLTSDKLLDTLTVTTVAGQVSYLDVTKTYKTYGQSLNLFIGYAATFASYKTNMVRGCISCSNPYGYSNPYVSVNSAKVLSASDKIDSNLEANSNNDGLSVTYSLNCSFEPFICANKQLLAQAIWYKAGELIARELKYSKRLNSVVMLYKTDAQELVEEYETRYDESMATITQNMRVPDNRCFNCNRRAKLQVNLP